MTTKILGVILWLAFSFWLIFSGRKGIKTKKMKFRWGMLKGKNAVRLGYYHFFLGIVFLLFLAVVLIMALMR